MNGGRRWITPTASVASAGRPDNPCGIIPLSIVPLMPLRSSSSSLSKRFSQRMVGLAVVPRATIDKCYTTCMLCRRAGSVAQASSLFGSHCVTTVFHMMSAAPDYQHPCPALAHRGDLLHARYGMWKGFVIVGPKVKHSIDRRTDRDGSLTRRASSMHGVGFHATYREGT